MENAVFVCVCVFCLSKGVLCACVLSPLRVLKISGRFETCLSLGAFISSGLLLQQHVTVTYMAPSRPAHFQPCN